MKFNMKAIAASVLFAVAGSSQAAIINGNDSADGNGELFISIFRDNLSPESMVIDTNVGVFDVRDGIVTGWTSTAQQTADILAFLGTAPITDFVFNAGATTNIIDIFDTTKNADLGVWFTTTGDGQLAPQASSDLETLRQKTGAQINDINNFNDADLDSVTGINDGELGYHDNSRLWGDSVGSTLGVLKNEAAVGTDLAVYNLFNGSTNPDPFAFEYEPTVVQYGFLSIDPATGVASWSLTAVPVPAAVWLFGSGMLGLVGVARRRKV